MQLIKRGDLRMLISDEGKHIRDIKDEYIPEHVDPETGETIPEHIPKYEQVLFLGIQVKDEDVPNLYVEELIEESEEN